MPTAMRYRNLQLQQRLALAYAAGTQSRMVRRRFAALRYEVHELDRLARQWDQHLSALTENVPGKTPRASVWQGIVTQTRQPRQPAGGWWNSVGFFKGLAAVVVAAVMVLSFTLIIHTHTAMVSVDYVAILESGDGQAMFVATTTRQTRVLTVQALVPVSPQNDEDWQLWAISKTDGEPRSVGLLDRGGTTTTSLNETGWRLITDAASLRITAEARGGSPIGEPNDRVVSSGLCVQLSKS